MAQYSAAFFNAAEFAAASFARSWLVEDIFVKGQPAVVGGPKKSMKTSIVVDLAVSLGTGTPFLGHFKVPRRRTVAVISGESGDATLQETANRICKSKNISLAEASVFWSFNLPRLNHPEDVAALQEFLEEQRVEVVIIDPLYLCLLGGSSSVSASNLYEVGPLLSRVANACLSVKATPILVHHATKAASKNPDEPPELDGLAFAGIGEFARQWILLKRRVEFMPGKGQHQLLMAVGGSAGQTGCWDVSIFEGKLNKNFGGRGWDVQLTPIAEKDQDEHEVRFGGMRKEKSMRLPD